MWNAVVAILLFTAANSAWAAGPVGDLGAWKGVYLITDCLQCRDHLLNDGTNLKNFWMFVVAVGPIADKDRQPCAQTDIWVDFVTTVASDDGRRNHSYNHMTGQCEWDTHERLIATDSTLDYELNGEDAEHKVKISMRKLASGKVEIIKLETFSNPRWGYPRAWTMRAEAEKQ